MITWVPYDLDQAREAMARYSTLEQRGLWSCGFMQGATGAILMGGEPGAYLDGYAAGKAAKEDADAYRAKLSEKRSAAAKKRWEKRGTDANECKSDAIASANAEQVHEQKQVQNGCKSDAQNITEHYRTEQEQEQEQGTNLSVNAARDRYALPGSGSADAGNNSRHVLADAETMTPKQIRAIPMPRPTRAQFLAYARTHWPEWHQPKVGSIYADLSAKGWTLEGKPVHDWTKLLAKLRTMADPAHIGERFPIGSALRTVAPDLSSMRFQA